MRFIHADISHSPAAAGMAVSKCINSPSRTVRIYLFWGPLRTVQLAVNLYNCCGVIVIWPDLCIIFKYSFSYSNPLTLYFFV